MTRPVEMPFWVWIGGGPRNHVLGGARIPNWKGHFLGGSFLCMHIFTRGRHSVIFDGVIRDAASGYHYQY